MWTTTWFSSEGTSAPLDSGKLRPRAVCESVLTTVEPASRSAELSGAKAIAACGVSSEQRYDPSVTVRTSSVMEMRTSGSP